MKSKASKSYLLFFIIFYFSVSLFLGVVVDKKIYPFFSWILFEKTPQVVQEGYALRIISIEKNILDEPSYFYGNRNFFMKDTLSSTEYHRVINQLGESLEEGLNDKILLYREVLEDNFVFKPISYEIVLIKFDLIERWQGNKLLEEKSLIVFESK